jgi:molybdopterin/thiamine biosynthesis adenylyltransferase
MNKPRIKSVYPPFPVGNGVIQIGGIDFGMAAEITDDEHGNTWALLNLLDGTRTEREVIAAMQRFNDEITGDDVREAIGFLTDSGYIEDAEDRPEPGFFSEEELARYDRNLEFFSYFNVSGQTKYDSQARLKRSRVTVLGLGGLGSYVALSLASAGVGDIRLVDDDVVDLSNLNRQVLYTSDDVGRHKCEAAAQRLALVNPNVRLEALNMRVDGIETARRCAAGRDLVICAADRPRVRIYEWLNQAAAEERVAWIRGANDGTTVLLFMHVPGETACFECEQIAAHAKYDWYKELLRHATDVIGDRTINPCTAPVAGIIGNICALEAVKYLTGVIDPVIKNRRMGFDLRGMSTWFTDGERQSDCPVCGSLGSGVEPVETAVRSPA